MSAETARRVVAGRGFISQWLTPIDGGCCPVRTSALARRSPSSTTRGRAAGYAPFAKHAVYPFILTPLYRIAGVNRLVALSMATVAAALLSALLARGLHARLAKPTLWVVGLASPLLIDGYLVIAHTIGAALAAGGMLAVIAAQRRPRAGPLAAAVACFGLGALLRNEIVLLGAAVVVVVGVQAIRRRSPGGAVVGVAVGATIVGTYLLDPLVTSWAGHLGERDGGGPSVADRNR